VTAFRDIITGDETWLHCYNPENKYQEYEVKASSIASRKKAQNAAVGEKFDAGCFFLCGGGVHMGKYWNTIKRGAQQ
jgi:hypothetical protein